MDQTKRLLALDVFRGLTIATMILVNNPGSWSTVYAPLLHADWHGCTPTDLVFPFFLFIVGISIAFAIGKRKESGVSHAQISKKIVIRAAIIFGLGLFLAAFPYFGMKQEIRSSSLALVHYVLLSIGMVSFFLKEVYRKKPKQKQLWLYIGLASVLGMAIIGFQLYDFSRLRIPGVLQRIALVYLICALLFLKTNWKTQIYLGVGFLLLYWILMTLIPVPGGYPPNLDPETNLGAWLDRTLLNGHLWSQSKTWDPEGLLSTLPAISTGISGILTGLWLKTNHSDYKKVTGLLAFGAILITTALAWDLVFPINKKIWTSSYVLYTSGLGLLFLGVVYWLIDILNYKNWIKPFVVYGMNPLFAYVLSGIIAKMAYYISWSLPDGSKQTLGNWIYNTVFTPYLNAYNASLGYALLNVLVVLGLCWILFNRKIFIKV